MSAQQKTLADEAVEGLAFLNKTGRKIPNTTIRKGIERDYLKAHLNLRQAHRFVLDDDMVRHITTVSHNTTPQKLLERLPSATLPYTTVWLEFNLHCKVMTYNALAGRKDDLKDTPKRLGLLFSRHTTNPSQWSMELVSEGYVDGDEAKGTIVAPFWAAYSLGQPSFPVDFEYKGASDVLAGYGWGYTRRKTDYVEVPECLKGKVYLTISSSAETVVRVGDPHRIAESICVVANENAGILRWAVTALAILSEVPTQVGEEVQPTGRRMVAGSDKPFLSYRRLTLHLPNNKDPVRYINRKLDHAVAARKRAHDVRGHWRNYHLVEGCEHTWQQADEDPTYRRCTSCGAFSRFIAEHVRGDATLGWVKKEYVLAGAKQ